MLCFWLRSTAASVGVRTFGYSATGSPSLKSVQGMLALGLAAFGVYARQPRLEAAFCPRRAFFAAAGGGLLLGSAGTVRRSKPTPANCRVCATWAAALLSGRELPAAISAQVCADAVPGSGRSRHGDFRLCTHQQGSALACNASFYSGRPQRPLSSLPTFVAKCAGWNRARGARSGEFGSVAISAALCYVFGSRDLLAAARATETEAALGSSICSPGRRSRGAALAVVDIRVAGREFALELNASRLSVIRTDSELRARARCSVMLGARLEARRTGLGCVCAPSPSEP
jgi:hypothetical protein